MTLKILRGNLRYKLIFVLVIFLSITNHLLAQEQMTEMTVDRPGFAETPYTVHRGVIQVEIGFDYFKRYNSSLYNLPTALLRTGINKKSEVRLTLQQSRDDSRGNVELGIAPISLGLKRHIVEQSRNLPEIDILANVIIPTSNSLLFSKTWGYEFLLLFENDFYPNSAINYNIGFTWDKNYGQSVFTANFCYNYLPSERTGLFIEYFGFMPGTLPSEHGIDGGLTYLLRRNLQIDFSVGISRVATNQNVFVSSGLSIRIDRQKNGRLYKVE
jgi:Putative MetA-pathway of phenol degradation